MGYPSPGRHPTLRMGYPTPGGHPTLRMGYSPVLPASGRRLAPTGAVAETQ
ncbi:MAG: hypothetical protein LIP12_07285 [Clostridiales bacterium]|nr:hypothetical protein [Clostridiales bacterium]